MKRAVVLLSGGIDSSTALAVAMSKGFECFAISFDYNQRHRCELESARKIARKLGVKRHFVIRFDMSEIGGSALTTDIEVPKKRAKYRRSDPQRRSASGSQRTVLKNNKSSIFNPSTELSRQSLQSSIPITYVPARNTIFLSFALGWAEVLETADIFIGANAVDYSGYPDCRIEYIKAYENMANLATKISVEGKLKFKINTPLISMTKGEIIKKGIELGLDYGMTWSCYDPINKKRPCLNCDSCIFRTKGFKEAGIADPLLK